MTPHKVATAVCKFYPGSTAEAILAPQRGTPCTAELRAISMLVWRTLNRGETYRQTGAAFGRDRRNVRRGLQRLEAAGLPTKHDLAAIVRLLTSGS